MSLKQTVNTIKTNWLSDDRKVFILISTLQYNLGSSNETCLLTTEWKITVKIKNASKMLLKVMLHDVILFFVPSMNHNQLTSKSEHAWRHIYSHSAFIKISDAGIPFVWIHFGCPPSAMMASMAEAEVVQLHISYVTFIQYQEFLTSVTIWLVYSGFFL